MARNRKFKTAAVRFAPAIKALLLCLLLGGSGIGYVWQKDQIIRLDRQYKNRELRLGALRDKNDGLRKQLSGMRSPGPMQERIRSLGLLLVEPQPNQKLRLPEPSAEPSRPDTLRLAGGQIARTTGVPK